MSHTLDKITQANINEVQYRIALKMNSNFPYYATKECTRSVMTDTDHFPYRRFYRGEYNSTEPIVLEREAGYRPRQDRMYFRLVEPNIIQPDYCWQYPCTSIKPCKPEGDKNKDKGGEDKKEESTKSEEKKCVKNYVIAP